MILKKVFKNLFKLDTYNLLKHYRNYKDRKYKEKLENELKEEHKIIKSALIDLVECKDKEEHLIKLDNIKKSFMKHLEKESEIYNHIKNNLDKIKDPKIQLHLKYMINDILKDNSKLFNNLNSIYDELSSIKTYNKDFKNEMDSIIVKEKEMLNTILKRTTFEEKILYKIYIDFYRFSK